jgi:hypothetical protein
MTAVDAAQEPGHPRTRLRSPVGARLSLLLLLLPLLAGCSGAGQEAESASAGRTGRFVEETPHVDVVRSPIEMTGAVGNQSIPADSALGGLNYGLFGLKANATAIVAEARWTCASPTCRFKLTVENLTRHTAGSAYGEGAARATVSEALKPGEWRVRLGPDSFAADVEGEFRISVFYGLQAPADYTAF